MPGAVRFQFSFIVSCILLFALFLFGETYVQYIVYGLIALFCLCTLPILKWQQFRSYRWLLATWLLFLGSLFLSTVYTSNFPLSLHRDVVYALGFAIFWIVLLLPSVYSLRKIAMVLVTVVLLLTVVSVAFQLLPPLAAVLPGMNVLHATFGHNHLGAVIILFLPLAWELSRQKEKKWLLLPVWLSVGLLVSFGRVLMVIGFTELIGLALLDEKLLKKGVSRTTFWLITICFTLVIGMTAWTSLVFSKADCPISSFSVQLCKSIAEENRPLYWRATAAVLWNNPWFGSGPGTYGIAAVRYSEDRYVKTSYTHNDYLQAFAELGYVGGSSFVLLITVLIWQMIGVIRRDKSSNSLLKLAMGIGVIAMSLNVFFDFDWQFSGTWIVTLILAALVIRQPAVESTEQPSLMHRAQVVSLQVMIGGVLILVTVLGFIALKTEYEIGRGNVVKAFELFPYFHWQRLMFQQAPLTYEQQVKLDNLYAQHPDYLYFEASDRSDPAKWAQYADQLVNVDPWYILQNDTISYHLSAHQFDRAYQVSQKKYRFLISTTYAHQQVSYEQNVSFAQQLVQLAAEMYATNNYKKAGELYQQAYSLDEWIFEKYAPPFDGTDIDWEEYHFFETNQSLQQYWQNSRGSYVRRQQLVAQALIEQSVTDNQTIEPWQLQKGLEIYTQLPYRDFSLVRPLILRLQDAVEINISRQAWDDSDQLVKAMGILNPQDYWIAMQPANLALLRGDLQTAQALYEICAEQFSSAGIPVHLDCQISAVKIAKSQLLDPDRYWQVDQIIRLQ